MANVKALSSAMRHLNFSVAPNCAETIENPFDLVLYTNDASIGYNCLFGDFSIRLVMKKI
jgi:hypothetical protein